jgi:tetratricopeptide (TPR) repeat protein
MVLFQYHELIKFSEIVFKKILEMDNSVATQLIELNELEKAKEILDHLIFENPADVQSLILRGHINYKMQQWGSAMNDYSAILEVDPNNPEAKSGLAMAQSILGYFTPDMFNP